MNKPAILVTSGKGGVGKTLVAINIALELSKYMKVALVDADVRAPNLTYVMGIANKKIDIDHNRKLIPYKYSDNLQIFSMEHFVARDNGIKKAIIIPGEEVRSIIDQTVYGVAWDNPDVFVFDSDPSTSDVLIELHKIFGKYLNALIVTTNDISSRFDAEREIDALIIYDISIIGIIGNMIFHGMDDGIKEIADKFKLKYFGYIPFDEKIRMDNNNGKAQIDYDVIKKVVGDILWQQQKN